MPWDMNTRMESLLASFTLGLMVLILVLIANNTFGQDRFLCAMGTSLHDARVRLMHVPYVEKELKDDLMVLAGANVRAEYLFDEGELDQIHLEQRFDSEKLAHTGLEVYLNYIQRTGAPVMLLYADKTQKVYSALGKDAAYELNLEMGCKTPTLKVRSWRRGVYGASAGREALIGHASD